MTEQTQTEDLPGFEQPTVPVTDHLDPTVTTGAGAEPDGGAAEDFRPEPPEPARGGGRVVDDVLIDDIL